MGFDELCYDFFTGSWYFVSDNSTPTFFDFKFFAINSNPEFAVAFDGYRPIGWTTFYQPIMRFGCVCQKSEFYMSLELIRKYF